MRERLLWLWVGLCVAVVVGGAAWWLRDVGWPGGGSSDAAATEIVQLGQFPGVSSDDHTVRLTLGVVVTRPEIVRDRPDLASIDVSLAVGRLTSAELRTPEGQLELRERLLDRLERSYPGAGIERVLVTDLFVGPPAPPEDLLEDP